MAARNRTRSRIKAPSSEYHIWVAMRHRCSNPNAQNYHRYGGRGIKVCERWQKFENFYADMGPKPPGKSLDRINNDLDYSPENCRWASSREQSRNRNSNVFIEHAGERLCMADWARRYGIKPNVLHQRLERGNSFDESISPNFGKPITHCKRGHEFTPENTYLIPRGRSCKTCRREATRQSQRRRRA